MKKKLFMLHIEVAFVLIIASALFFSAPAEAFECDKLTAWNKTAGPITMNYSYPRYDGSVILSPWLEKEIKISGKQEITRLLFTWSSQRVFGPSGSVDLRGSQITSCRYKIVWGDGYNLKAEPY